MKNKAEEYNSRLMDEISESISPIEERKIKSKMLLAAKIEDAMKAKGWNKTKLLEATGQKNASVATKWFSGTHNFTHDTLFDIQEALGIKLLDIAETSEEIVVQYHVITSASVVFKNDNLKRKDKIKEVPFKCQNPNFTIA